MQNLLKTLMALSFFCYWGTPSLTAQTYYSSWANNLVQNSSAVSIMGEIAPDGGAYLCDVNYNGFGGSVNFQGGGGSLQYGHNLCFYNGMFSLDWILQLPGLYFSEYELDSAHNAYVLLNANTNYAGTTDLNPRGAPNPVSFSQVGPCWLAKYNPAGQLLWAHEMGRVPGGSSLNVGRGLAVKPNGNVVVCFTADSLADIDPGPGVFNTTGAGHTLAEYDLNGNFIWGKSIVSPNALPGNGEMMLRSSAFNELFLYAKFSGTLDLDPGPGTNLVTSGGGVDYFIACYDSVGNMKWGQPVVGGSWGANVQLPSIGLEPDVAGGVFLGFRNLPTSRLNRYDDQGNLWWSLVRSGNQGVMHANGDGTVWVGNTRNNNAMVQLFDLYGNAIEEVTYAGASSCYTNSMITAFMTLTGDDIVALGQWTSGGTGPTWNTFCGLYTLGNNTPFYGDTTAFSPPINYWGTRVTNAAPNQITGTVYADVNLNSQLDPTDARLPYQIVRRVGNKLVATNHDGEYQFLLDQWPNSVNYSLSMANVMPPFTSNPVSAVANLPGGGPHIDSLNHFGLTAPSPFKDLGISLQWSGLPRTGSNVNAYLLLKNKGWDSINGQIKVEKPAGFVLNSSSLVPDSIVQDTLYFTYPTLPPLVQDQLILNFNISTQMVTGTPFSFKANAPVAGDIVPSDNSLVDDAVIQGPYDPNYKEVSPRGSLPVSTVQAGTFLDYTIHFQNIGNDTALKVVVIDSLPTGALPTSMQVLGYSFPPTMELTTAGIVKFTFDGIELPDSATNEPASHGFVSFRVDLDTNLNIGDRLENRAAIYFDYEYPIVTNTVQTTIAEFAYAVDVVSPVCPGDSIGSIAITTTDTLGVLMFSLDGGAFQSNPQFVNVSSGLHQLVVTDQNAYADTTDVVVLGASAMTLNTSIQWTSATMGSITVNPIGGSPPYQYSFAGAPFQGSNTLNSVGPGTYSITVQDFNGCTVVDSVVLNALNLIAVDDTVVVPEDSNTILLLLNNDTLPPNIGLRVDLLSTGVNGLAISAGQNQVTYLPNSNFFGQDSFAYAVCDTASSMVCDTAMVRIFVTSVNDSPLALPDRDTTAANTPITWDIQANDLDPDGDPLQTTLLSSPLHGTVSVINGDSLYFVPDNGFVGLDSIHYQVCDGGLPNLCDSAWAVLVVSTVLSVEESVAENASELAVFPNPNQGRFDIQIPPGLFTTYNLLLIDPLGRRVMVLADQKGDRLVLDLEGKLAGGIYLLLVTDGRKSRAQRIQILND